ncbi:MAG: S1 RNA-binding domain-containing protein [Clostridia bacterium]|nr:S1 RNA-binding domain-containing protein [Clostridia bacterium]
MKEFYPEGFLRDDFKNKKAMQSLGALITAQDEGQIMEANVIMCDAEHNMTVDLGIMRGIIPREEGAIGIAEGITRDIALISRVGRPVCFTVTRFDTDSIGRTYAVLSRRNAQEMCRESILANKRCGDIINARVTHMENFGAFCDIGCGNIALLPIDTISVSRISHPRDRFRVGDNIRVIIKNIADDGKITLSHKELLGTWQENACKISQGQTVSGVVRSIENYGIFVELAPNLAGLAEPRESVSVGQTASVYIKSIIPEKMKIKLIIIDSFGSDFKTPLEYFYSGDHIDSFEYAPECCARKNFTQFSG